MRQSTKTISSAFILLSILICTGCQTAKEPLYKSETFKTDKIETIYVLPVADLRFNKDKELPKLDKWVHKIVKDKLKDKKYGCTILSDRSLVSSLTEDELKNFDTQWVKSLGSSESRWIMLFALWDARSKLTFGSTGNAEVSLYMFDKQDGSLIWKDKDVARVGMMGLAGMFMKGSMLGDAVKNAIMQLMINFPKNEV